MDRQTIHALEAGHERKARDVTLGKFAKAYALDVEELMDLQEQMN